MRILRSLAWALMAASWLAAFSLPFRGSDLDGEVLVIFPPWAAPQTQVSALTDAELFLGKRLSGFALTGVTPDGWDKKAELYAGGALLVTASTSFSICSQRNARPSKANKEMTS